MGFAGLPDGMQTVSGDAAGEVSVQLGGGEQLAAARQSLGGLGGYLDFGQAAGKGSGTGPHGRH